MYCARDFSYICWTSVETNTAQHVLISIKRIIVLVRDINLVNIPNADVAFRFQQVTLNNYSTHNHKLVGCLFWAQQCSYVCCIKCWVFIWSLSLSTLQWLFHYYRTSSRTHVPFAFQLNVLFLEIMARKLTIQHESNCRRQLQSGKLLTPYLWAKSSCARVYSVNINNESVIESKCGISVVQYLSRLTVRSNQITAVYRWKLAVYNVTI
jgi:hypothetical protein